MKEFKNDIAIIYPYQEDQTKHEADHIWVSEFKRYLGASLHQLIDETVAIEQFSVHPGNVSVNELINENAVFICLISPEYVENESYKQVIQEIYDFQKETGINRIFHVVKFPITSDELPEWLQFEPQYAFYDKKPNTRKYIEIDFSRELNETHVIWHKLTDLVYDIHESIIALNDQVDARNNNFQYSIFIAEVTPDQEENRNKIIREMKQQGYNVFPKHNLPVRSKEMEPILLDILDKCIMSIHMMGGLYGTYLKDSRYSVSDYLNRTVRNYLKEIDLSNRKFKRIVWLPPYLKISDQRQDLFLGRLKREENDPATELIQSPLEELKTLIFKSLNDFKKNMQIGTGRVSSVYIVHDPLKTNSLEQYEQFFQDKAIRALSLSFDDEESIINEHINNLRYCDSVLVIANNNQNWLEAKLRDIVKVKGYGREKPFSFKAVITESDEGLNKLDEKITKDVIFLSNNRDLTTSLEPLLKKMEESHA